MMQSSWLIPESELQACSSSPPHLSRDQQHELTTPQPKVQDEISKSLPRVPRATDTCPRPWNLDQVGDWLILWGKNQRVPTQTERDDWEECNRQFNVWANESPSDIEEDDGIFDLRPVLLRPRRQRPLSPPQTPPYLKGSKLYKNREPGPVPRPCISKVEKVKSKSRVAPRRPFTRSQGWTTLSLDDRKGHIRYWPVDWRYMVLSYDHYLKNYYREELDRNGPEKLDLSYEHPDRPSKTPWQRETCRRWDIHQADRKKEVNVSLHYKGHR